MRRFKIDKVRNGEAYLRGQEARHALKVLRLKKGDEIIVFDGEGKEYLAVISAASPTSVKLKILEETNVNRDSPLDSTLYMGITNKVQKLELAIQKTTELGVKRIVPVICRRSSTAQLIKNWEGKLRRWREIAVNASKQCGRTVIPEISEPVKIEEIEDSSDLSFVLWEKGGKSFKDYQSYSASSVSFLVGPEGGLEKEEIELLKERGFKPIYLGKRILRAETAAIAGMTLIQYIWGDLG
ncbi:16S rRNA (uracil1498-N3)-methyltransferase [Thermovibrio guaymasensis]|uniref:Ribosomal RNA small subunit methyltransferase E n=1 Tax=Thermovibrio guaymasensis TaxID=240167 RepID=A0A420W7V9_9BACT|nr:16S rRNA (uracil(1498)-N(3))-methyltransferase [Thermovibrio guaymasensis]RKQ63362.1 16S rRNA (uracil1498-N3)-methyltransferase [Thermovibrio guaymasensis]